MKINGFRDSVSALVGFASGGAGLVGTAAKKTLINEGDSFGKRFGVGLAASLLTGGLAIIPYLLATPGGEAKADVQNSRAQSFNDRY